MLWGFRGDVGDEEEDEEEGDGDKRWGTGTRTTIASVFGGEAEGSILLGMCR